MFRVKTWFRGLVRVTHLVTMVRGRGLGMYYVNESEHTSTKMSLCVKPSYQLKVSNGFSGCCK